MIRNLLALLGVAALALLAAIGIRASGYWTGDDAAPARVPVSYAGLDLSSPAGMRILESRVDAAVRDICDREGTAGLSALAAERRCRRDAYASVRPQIAAALGRAPSRLAFAAQDARWSDDDRGAGDGARWSGDDQPADAGAGWTGDDADRGDAARWSGDDAPPPPPDARDAPPPPPPPAPAAATPPAPGMRLVRRTVTTTRTVTTGAPGAAIAAPKPKPRPAKAPVQAAAYRRHPVAGSYLPPAAWRTAERATLRAFATGRLTRWMVGSREGYVTVSPARRIAGCTCRNVRVVKYGWGRQIVVASGTRCRRPGGPLR